MLDDPVLIELVVDACRRAEQFYPQFDSRSGDTLTRVYLNVSRAVMRNPQDRGNEKYVRIVAERQAHREFRKLLRDRLPPTTRRPPDESPESCRILVRRCNESGYLRLGYWGGDPSDLAERAESLQQLAGWTAGLPGDEKVLLRTLTDGWTLAQAGSFLNVDSSTVSRRRASLLEHARRALDGVRP